MIDARTAPYAALLLRLTLGVALLAHGLMKILVFTLPGTVGFFQSLGLPGFLAYLVVLVEVVAGLALILGFKTRIAALIAVPVLLGAAWVHAPNGWVFSNPNGGWEFPVFWTAALLVQSLLGDGAYAVSRSSPALKTA
ncbi:MAG: DoxX family protein [Parvibaculaceae bacterium]